MSNIATEALLKKLISYQSGEISRAELEKEAEMILESIRERMKTELNISDIFLSQMLRWLTTEKYQAYQENEIQKLIDGLKGERSVRYHSFVRISQEMLFCYEKQILDIATEFLSKRTVPGEWIEISQRRMHERTEFRSVTTIPEWLAYQIEYLLWLVKTVNRKNFDVEEETIIGKIKYFVSILSGKETALIEVGINSVSIL